MRTDTPLWEKVYLGKWGMVYVNAAKIIGHLGCGEFAFYDAAKLLPGYDKYRYENAVRDLCVCAKREQGQYELHATARKVLKVVLGPPPDSPEYAKWWEARLVSVRQMKEQGQTVEWAKEPPVPLAPQEAPKKPQAKKTAAKKVGKK